jgi:hypothetical protein
LSICEDGTFVLQPTQIKIKDHHRRLLLPVRGQWNVLENPYCITDRFYDQLTLKSYPRVETTARSRLPLQSLNLDFSCRLVGKHAKSELVGRKGRMTHGTLVWKQHKQHQQQHNKRWHFNVLPKPKPVVASFSAKRSAQDPEHEGWEDQEYFGY